MNNLYELRGMLSAMIMCESDEYTTENLDRCICLLDLAIDQLKKPKVCSGNIKIYGTETSSGSLGIEETKEKFKYETGMTLLKQQND